MGADSFSWDEKPAHKVTVAPFFMDITEVTQREFESLMGFNPSKFKREENPVETVSWFHAILFCNEKSKKHGLDTVYSYSKLQIYEHNYTKLCDVKIDYTVNGFRLPSEAEWEYACKAGTNSLYYWGDSASGLHANGYDKGDWPDDGAQLTSPVGRYKKNQFGLYDMIGNVSEWCNEKHSIYCEESDSLSIEITHDTTLHTPFRVYRGGGWGSSAMNLRASRRFASKPIYWSSEVGFRTVLPKK